MEVNDNQAIWSLIGNVKPPGTKNFSAGAKLYCLPAQWGDGYENIYVVGHRRNSRRIIGLIMPSNRIENWRAKRVYSPKIQNKFERMRQKDHFPCNFWPDHKHAAEYAISLLNADTQALTSKQTSEIHMSHFPKIKICGLTRPQDVEAAIESGVDFLGFIVEAKSSRRLSAQAAARLAQPASGIAPVIAVTVNPDDALLSSIIRLMKPDFIQLHGDETPDRAAQIKAKYGIGMIKALPISAPQDLECISEYDSDYILLDAKPPKGAARGGHGQSFDWKMLEKITLPKNWILAGGLSAENAGLAAAQTNAPILDVSSGVESAPGIKDASKIKALIDAVKHEQSR